MCDFTYISKINLFLNLKRNKTSDNKSTTVAWINEFGDTYACTTVELVSSRSKINKTEDYINKYNRRRFREEKNQKYYNGGKSRKCLPCYRAKPTFCSRSLQ